MHPRMGMYETLPRARTGTSCAATDRLIGESQCWGDFWRALQRLDSSARDTAFERLTQLYLQTSPEYRTQLQNVWLLNEVPESVSARLNLPRQDEGIDIVAEDVQGGAKSGHGGGGNLGHCGGQWLKPWQGENCEERNPYGHSGDPQEQPLRPLIRGGRVA
jgi:hypothetical protein